VADNELPSEVGRLIDEFVASVDHIEVLMQFHATPHQPATVESLVAGGHVDRVGVIRVLRDLESAAVVRESDGTYRYAPSTRDAHAVDALFEMYRTRPVTLIRAVYARPTASQLFGDALRQRKAD
jgi:hypothetical protein